MTAVHALRAVEIPHRRAAPMAAPAPPPAAPRSRLRDGFSAAGDTLALLAVAFSLPFIILAVGTPVAVALMALLWIIRSL
jgi:hypothetical protein